jgi:hypothetical protein
LLREHGGENYFISLIFLDFCERNLQKLHTVECPMDYIYIMINKADPTTFLLYDYIASHQTTLICKIVDKTIIIGDILDIDFYPHCFYGKYIYLLGWNDEDQASLLFICIVNAFNILDTSNLYLQCRNKDRK